MDIATSHEAALGLSNGFCFSSFIVCLKWTYAGGLWEDITLHRIYTPNIWSSEVLRPHVYRLVSPSDILSHARPQSISSLQTDRAGGSLFSGHGVRVEITSTASSHLGFFFFFSGKWWKNVLLYVALTRPLLHSWYKYLFSFFFGYPWGVLKKFLGFFWSKILLELSVLKFLLLTSLWQETF